MINLGPAGEDEYMKQRLLKMLSNVKTNDWDQFATSLLPVGQYAAGSGTQVGDILGEAVSTIYNQYSDWKSSQPQQSGVARERNQKSNKVTQLAKQLQKKWQSVFKRRDLAGYERFIRWRMKNYHMTPSEAAQDLNRLWSERYRGRGRKRKPEEQKAPQRKERAPGMRTGPGREEAPQAPPGTPKAEPEAAPAKKEEPKEDQATRYVRQKASKEWSNAMTQDRITRMRNRIWREMTGRSLNREDYGDFRLLNRWVNQRLEMAKDQYMRDRLEGKPADEADPELYFESKLRNDMSRMDIESPEDVQRLVKNIQQYGPIVTQYEERPGVSTRYYGPEHSRKTIRR